MKNHPQEHPEYTIIPRTPLARAVRLALDHRGTNLAASTVMVGALLLASTPVAAQDELTLEEVIVTAQKREQNLQEIPMTK